MPTVPSPAATLDPAVNDPTDRSRPAALAALATICARPLPPVPASWLANRWHGGQWSAHTDTIICHPAYNDLYTWIAARHPRRYQHWELMAAVAITHAGRVAAGQIDAADLARLIARSRRTRTVTPPRREIPRDPLTLAAWLPDNTPTTPRQLGGLSASQHSNPSQNDPGQNDRGQRPGWTVIDWMIEAIGAGWLTPTARDVLEDALTLVADLADTRPAVAAPSAAANPADRITTVLAHLPRPARQAVRTLIFGPTDKSRHAGLANSLIVRAATQTDIADLPDELVALWRYHAVALDPYMGTVMAASRVPRRRLQRNAARHPAGQPVHVERLFNGEDRPNPTEHAAA